MFGIFRNKQKATDDAFKASLQEFSSFFSERTKFFNSTQNQELVTTVFAVYLQRNPDESGRSVSECYFDSLIGNIVMAVDQGILPKHGALQMWKQTNTFLSSYPDFNDKVVKICMSNWKDFLIHKGVDRLNFDLA
jgi:hypothetical protein